MTKNAANAPPAEAPAITATLGPGDKDGSGVVTAVVVAEAAEVVCELDCVMVNNFEAEPEAEADIELVPPI